MEEGEKNVAEIMFSRSGFVSGKALERSVYLWENGGADMYAFTFG